MTPGKAVCAGARLVDYVLGAGECDLHPTLQRCCLRSERLPKGANLANTTYLAAAPFAVSSRPA